MTGCRPSRRRFDPRSWRRDEALDRVRALDAPPLLRGFAFRSHSSPRPAVQRNNAGAAGWALTPAQDRARPGSPTATPEASKRPRTKAPYLCSPSLVKPSELKFPALGPPACLWLERVSARGRRSPPPRRREWGCRVVFVCARGRPALSRSMTRGLASGRQPAHRPGGGAGGHAPDPPLRARQRGAVLDRGL
jgi:hypothetical protein